MCATGRMCQEMAWHTSSSAVVQSAESCGSVLARTSALGLVYMLTAQRAMQHAVPQQCSSTPSPTAQHITAQCSAAENSEAEKQRSSISVVGSSCVAPGVFVVRTVVLMAAEVHVHTVLAHERLETVPKPFKPLECKF